MQAVWVSSDVLRKAESLAVRANGKDAKEAVELLLQNDQSAGTGDAIPGTVNAGEVLAKALKALESHPHAALEVPIGAKTQEIRKAYKKAALKYHPDKNPKTTPLFVAIQSACDKLSDRDQRAKAEKAAERSAAAAPSSSRSHPPPPPPKHAGYEQNQPRRPGAPAAASHAQPQAKPSQYQQYQYQQQQQQQQQAHKYASYYDQKQQQQQQQAPPKYSAYEHKTSSSNNDAHGGGGGSSHRQAPPKVPDFDEEIRKRQAAAAARRAEDLKAAAAREAAAQKERDDIYKAGQKAYFDEQAKLRRAAHEREKMAAEAADARRRAMYGANNAPSAGPAPPAGPPPPPAADKAAKPSQPTKPSAAAFAAAEAAYSAYNNKKKYEVPVPIAFKCTHATESSVELEWRISLYCTKAVLIELSWRRQVNTSAWQSAPKLISGFKCKKNNLDLGPTGGKYEFRIRAIEDLPGGMLGERSAWTETLVIDPVKPRAAPAPAPAAPSAPPVPPSSHAAKASQAAAAPPAPPSSYHYVYSEPKKEVVRPKAPEKAPAPPAPPMPPASTKEKDSSYPAYIYSEKVKVGTAASAAPAPPVPSAAPAPPAPPAATAAAPTAAASGPTNPVPAPASKDSDAGGFTKPVRPTVNTSRPRRQTAHKRNSSSGGAAADDASAASAAAAAEGDDEDDAKSIKSTRSEKGPQKDKEKKEKKSLTPRSRPPPISPMCTSQPDFSRSRKAWEDIMSSPRAVQARAQAYEESKEHAPMSAARSRRHSVDGPLAPKRGAFSPQRRHSVGDELERDNEVEVEEVVDEEEEEEVLRSSGAGKDVNGDDDSIEDESEAPQAWAVKSAEKRPKRPSGAAAAVLRPKQLNKKAVPPSAPSAAPPPAPAAKVASAAAAAANGTTGRELWFQLMPPTETSSYQHPVREEPLQGAEEVGYLVPGLAVLAQAVVGEWAKVRYHKKRLVMGKACARRSDGWGWCLVKDPATGAPHLLPTGDGGEEVEEEVGVSAGRNLLSEDEGADEEKEGEGSDSECSTANHVSSSFALDDDADYRTWQWADSKAPKGRGKGSAVKKKTPAAAATDAAFDEWFERYDERGGVYYYNAQTGESSWTAPAWVVETDPVTAAPFYMQLNASDGAVVASTWEAPAAPCVRLHRRTEQT